MPLLTSHPSPLMQCFHLSGTSDCIFADSISGLQKTLEDRFICALLRYRLCMRRFPLCARCSCCSSEMETSMGTMPSSTLVKLPFVAFELC